MKRRLRIYVAGAYAGPDVIAILGNMRRGLQLSLRVLQAGFAPFSPWLDYQFSLLGEVTLADYLAYSVAWLEAADAVIVVPVNLEGSKGSQAELARARDLNIPIFESMSDLQDWAAKREGITHSDLPTTPPDIEMHGGLPYGRNVNTPCQQ